MARRRKRSANDIAALLFKALLSSGLLAVLASLSGLMYRAGWLSRFGVSADLFLPDSAAEISFWTFLAMLEVWTATTLTLREHFWWLPVLVAGGLLIGTLAAFISLWIERRTPLRNRLIDVWRNKWTGLTVSFSGMLVSSSVVPWLATTLTAIPLLLPVWTITMGQERAGKSITAYNNGNTTTCSSIEGPAGEITRCALVIAQTKEKAAFMNGDQVHVVPSDGLHISWRRPDSKKPD